MTRVLIISSEPIGTRMAGPAIRDWEYARVLSQTCQVTIAAPDASGLQPNGFTLKSYQSHKSLAALVAQADVVITSGYTVRRHPFLKRVDRPLVLNLTHSFVLEGLQQFADEGMSVRREMHREFVTTLNELLLVGDLFVCNTERQRDFWLGMLSALGRVNPLTFDADPSLRNLVVVVPFGLPDEPPRHTRSVLKGVYKGIAPHDKVILWGGGIYDWLDPLTLIRAMALVVKRRPDARLFFPGTHHPNPGVLPSRKVDQTLQLSDALGLRDRWVFFHDWVPYAERQNYLLEANVGISLHLDHLETRYAFRTRVLDYIWAGLPMVVTEGDAAAELVASHDLGRVVGYGDVEGVATALLELLETPNLRTAHADNFAAVREQFRWSQTMRPLIKFCQSPRKAPDRMRDATDEYVRAPAIQPRAGWGRWLVRLQKGWHCYRQGGLGALWREVRAFARWRWPVGHGEGP